MTSTKTRFLFFAACAFSLAACSGEKQPDTATETYSQQQTSTVAHEATAPAGTASLPSFVVQDKNGKQLNLQSLRGKKVFLNLWATWCPPCRAEMPSIAKLYKDAGSNAVFVLLSLDDDFEKAKRYVKSRQLDLPVYYPAENLPALLNVDGIPTTFIFDESGNLVKKIEGSDNYDTKQYRSLLQ